MFLQRPVDNPPSPVEVKPILVIVFLVSLLVEHCKFDQLRSENESWKADLDTVSPVCESLMWQQIFSDAP